MITQKTIVSQIEIIPGTKTVQVRFSLIVESDGKEISRTYHRGALMPDTDPANYLQAINDNLGLMGREPVPADEWNKVLEHHRLVCA